MPHEQDPAVITDYHTSDVSSAPDDPRLALAMPDHLLAPLTVIAQAFGTKPGNVLRRALLNHIDGVKELLENSEEGTGEVPHIAAARKKIMQMGGWLVEKSMDEQGD